MKQMTSFQKALVEILSAKDQSQNRLASQCGVDVAQLNRVLKGKFRPSPEMVGRMVGSLPRDVGALLLKAYLDGIVAEVASTKEPGEHGGYWQPPSQLKVETTVMWGS